MSMPAQSFLTHLSRAKDSTADPELRLASAMMLAGEGLFAEMDEVAQNLATHAALAVKVNRLALTCRQFERWGLHHRLRPWSVPGRGDAELVRLTRCALTRQSAGARDAIIVFVGAASQYWVTLHLLERLLPQGRHLLFLKDPDWSSFLFGTPAFGRRHADVARGLRHFLQESGAERFHVLGTSSGGFAALHAALTMGAAGVLALSPETTLQPLADRLRASTARPWPADADPRLPQPIDLRDLLAQPRPDCGPALLMHGADHPADAAMCKRLQGAPGVSIEALPDCAEHDILRPLMTAGLVKPLFERVFSRDDLSY